MDGFTFQFHRFCRVRRRIAFVVGMTACVVLVYQTLMMPSRHSLLPLIPTGKIPVLEEQNPPREVTVPESMMIGRLSLLNDSENSTLSSIDLKEAEIAEFSNMRGETDSVDSGALKDDDFNHDSEVNEDPHPNGRFPFVPGDRAISNRLDNPACSHFKPESSMDIKGLLSPKNAGGIGYGLTSVSDCVTKANPTLVLQPVKIMDNASVSLPHKSISASSSEPLVKLESIVLLSGENIIPTLASSGQQVKEALLKKQGLAPIQNVSSNAASTGAYISLAKRKRVMPPIYISDTNHLLFRNHSAYASVGPLWSARDREIFSAKAQIENATPVVKNDRELYAPLFRNISMFKRSYELMQQTLKIYVYEEGEKPIFHQPFLKGIYSSEGWFMKLMETDRYFVVRNYRKAHLFYIPFSSRNLQFALHVPNSQNRRHLEEYLKNYVDMIAAKYPFWNRTGGADHFVVACHDWAPFETRHTMEHSIRALCTADLRRGFRLGKDVSLPQTSVRSPLNPLKELGGSPANRRSILAFFAGNMHGSLRPKLLHHWENKDPNMKIFGLLPGGVKERKSTYIQYMKTSKYCICPKGHEANSPRIAESIFYECVPVIISDNYVLPFLEVLNWEAFSVILQEKDIPRLKEMLESIPEERYRALQMGVRKAQKHFLWHDKPVKYDLFHMILHSIWFNTVYQIESK